MLSIGSNFMDYLIGPKIGQGAFGEIYLAIDTKTGILWAIKTENNEAKRKTLEFEYQVLAQIQSSPHFPRLGIFGKCSAFSFYSMEILGPSITNILKLIHDNRFSFSTTIRTIYHMLKCIESFHIFGLVHRDIKPGNILTREGHEHPLCLVDFGLSHVYVDPQTGKILPPRKHLGFRGTKVYASIHAHKGEDLGRRDDLMSWFYVSMELLTGHLPWRGKNDKNEVLRIKMHYNVQEAIGNKIPEMVTIYQLLSRLSFSDTPNYAQIFALLDTAMKRNHIKMDDPYDWSDILHSQRQKTAHALENLTVKYKLNSVKPVADLNDISMNTPLLPHISASAPFSQREDDPECCC